MYIIISLVKDVNLNHNLIINLLIGHYFYNKH